MEGRGHSIGVPVFFRDEWERGSRQSTRQGCRDALLALYLYPTHSRMYTPRDFATDYYTLWPFALRLSAQ